MDDHFPNLGEAQQRAERFGIDVERSYRMLLFELAPAKAKDLLMVSPDPENTCVVCGVEVPAKAKTCSGACRIRLFRMSNK
ncbi:MAG: hypothetical protein OEV86_13940 [Candidatus Krumholzibacteria bacterium]|nr:hypothetical protein [Candidatus Krumholzibacteria bacterium]